MANVTHSALSGANLHGPNFAVTAGAGTLGTTPVGNGFGLSFSNGSGVSFGINASTMTASVAAGATATGNVGGIAGGTSTATSGTIVFSNSGAVSFGLNGQTMTATHALTGDYWDNAPWGSGLAATAAFTGDPKSVTVFPLMPQGEPFPFDFTAGTAMIQLSISGSAVTMTSNWSSTFGLGVYTLNGSQLSLLNSGSGTLGVTANAANSDSYAGIRYFTFHSTNWSSTPAFKHGSKYWGAISWSSGGQVNQTGGIYAFSGGLSLLTKSGTMGAVSNAAITLGNGPYMGYYTASTAAFPAAIASNDLFKQNASAVRIPLLFMVNNTALTQF